MELQIPDLTNLLLNELDRLWTFMLLAIRFMVLFSILPGLSATPTAKQMRNAGVLTMVLAAMYTSPVATLPENAGMLAAMCFSEALLGMSLAMIPLMIVSGIQMAGGLSATTMGLGAGQLFDPVSGTSVTSLSRLFGDLIILLFLALDGHHLIIYAAGGMGGVITPGTFIVSEPSVSLMVNRFGEIFKLGVMAASPVIVALLLTNFVMGLITKAVPQVNIFIVSFPLTIGIGLILSALSLPELIIYFERQMTDIESSILVLVGDP